MNIGSKLQALIYNVEPREVECGRHGKKKTMSLNGIDPICPECFQEQIRAEYRADSKKQRDDHFARRTGMPRRHIASTFENYDVSNEGQKRALNSAKRYAETFAENLEAGRCLIMFGKPGNGKTHLACAIMQAIMKTGYTAKYCDLNELISTVREGYKASSAQSTIEIEKSFSYPDMLVVDEVGTMRGTNDETTILTNVLSARYNAIKPVIIISNLDKEPLQKALGDRIVDRLRENNGGSIPFTWESHRGKN